MFQSIIARKSYFLSSTEHRKIHKRRKEKGTTRVHISTSCEQAPLLHLQDFSLPECSEPILHLHGFSLCFVSESWQ